jgi:nitrous oxide reductase
MSMLDRRLFLLTSAATAALGASGLSGCATTGSAGAASEAGQLDYDIAEFRGSGS